MGGLSGSSKCRKGLHAWPCSGAHHRSGYRGAGSPYRCTVLAASSILRLHLVVLKVVHEMFGEVEGARAGVHRPVEKQMTLCI